MKNTIISSGKISLRLPTRSPFILAAHHRDLYPKGNDEMGPAESMADRNIGQDFDETKPWRMYHGSTVPGFPVHPHRGFETVTIVEEGFVDHTDSDGGAGRYGEGDVQWMTAGAGMQHCEMFPLLATERGNPLELFQIWLNLPRKDKMVTPHYTMLWNEEIPIVEEQDANGNITRIKLVAGDYGAIKALPPAPNSWAADKENNVAIWLIFMEPDASFFLRPTIPGSTRMVYFYEGDTLRIDDEIISSNHYAELVANAEISFANGKKGGKFLLLEGKPINEPMASYGPFVMNTEKEIQETLREYRETQFGGWPWTNGGPVHPRESGRFARYGDGTMEYPRQK